MRRYRLSNIGMFGVFFLLSACAEDGATDGDIAVATRPVVYGEDDRVEWYAYPERTFQALAAESTVALVHESLLEIDENGDVHPPDNFMGEVFDLCPDERFWHQPAMAECSGTLVDDDLVLTAGHCLEAVPCEAWRFVFGYYYEAPDRLHPMRVEDVYRCSQVVAAEVSLSDSDFEVDYAWVRLDRPVTAPYRPAPVARDDDVLDIGERTIVLSYGAGLPVKLDSGGEVVDGRPDSGDYFIATNDNFHGGSGAGVFDSEGYLRGVVARGEDDYILYAEGEDCLRIRSDSNDWLASAEEATYFSSALDGLCLQDDEPSMLCDGIVVPDDEEVDGAHRNNGSCAVVAPSVSGSSSIVKLLLTGD